MSALAMQSESIATIEEVLSFWFGAPARNADELRAKLERWFPRGAELDGEIIRRFGATLEAARQGALDHWVATLRGRLALITVLDQFPRHIYRNRPECYASDRRAQELVLEVVDAKQDSLSIEERLMLRMPFAHAEDLSLQERSLRETERLCDEVSEELRAVVSRGRERARMYYSIIERFGRFPHRNAICGRESTPAERAFLATEWPHPSGGGA